METIARKSGIRVLEGARGSDIPIVKGIGIVKGNVVDVLAVIDDVPGAPSGLTTARTPENWRRPPRMSVLYHRSAVTRPVSDRDAVVWPRWTRILRPSESRWPIEPLVDTPSRR